MGATHWSQVHAYRKRLVKKARTHRLCREAEKSLLSASTTCKKVLRAVKANETLLCNRESLTAHPLDLVSLCEPSTLEPLEMWLKDMMETFAMRHTLWQKDSGMCQEAKHVALAQEDACRTSKEKLKSQGADCDGKLDEMQTFACSWVTGFASRCTSYDISFASVRLDTPTKFVRRTYQFCGGKRVGWPLPGWSVWRMP